MVFKNKLQEQVPSFLGSLCPRWSVAVCWRAHECHYLFLRTIFSYMVDFDIGKTFPPMWQNGKLSSIKNKLKKPHVFPELGMKGNNIDWKVTEERGKIYPQKSPRSKMSGIMLSFYCCLGFFFSTFLSHIFSNRNEKTQHTDKPLMQKTTFIWA